MGEIGGLRELLCISGLDISFRFGYPSVSLTISSPTKGQLLAKKGQ